MTLPGSDKVLLFISIQQSTLILIKRVQYVVADNTRTLKILLQFPMGSTKKSRELRRKGEHDKFPRASFAITPLRHFRSEYIPGTGQREHGNSNQGVAYYSTRGATTEGSRQE